MGGKVCDCECVGELLSKGAMEGGSGVIWCGGEAKFNGGRVVGYGLNQEWVWVVILCFDIG